MTKNYQTTKPMTSAELRLAMPETVSVAMAESAEDMQEGLLALAVGAGLQVMHTLMEENVTAACGPRGKHDPNRAARSTAAVSCRCRRTSCSTRPRCWARWRWGGCWPGCRRAATGPGWNRSA